MHVTYITCESVDQYMCILVHKGAFGDINVQYIWCVWLCTFILDYGERCSWSQCKVSPSIVYKMAVVWKNVIDLWF